MFSTWKAIESGYEFVGLQLESGFICRAQFFQIEQLPADRWQVLEMVEWHQRPIGFGPHKREQKAPMSIGEHLGQFLSDVPPCFDQVLQRNFGCSHADKIRVIDFLQRQII